MSLYTELGMGLVFVGMVLVVNGLWLLGKGSDRDTAILNFFVGALTLFIAVWWAFGGEASEGTAFNAAGTLLFSFTYLWVGANAYRQASDQRSLGWYCILVTVLAIPTGYLVLLGGDVGLALLWWVWAILWAGFWLLLARQRSDYTTPVAWYTVAVGIVTGAAGYLMAAGFWPWGV
ncbi:AmiS/UreI family transporter [Halomarina ordinaria]|uniref:AmiS/UreI family transporter n=1 Tax=Halomarina ordinaria TaxID=3033939 RepID=A0ABD5UCA8_9EURY|nr:AmiS/UreI family transporter [Halomarina sp. PSRA2]